MQSAVRDDLELVDDGDITTLAAFAAARLERDEIAYLMRQARVIYRSRAFRRAHAQNQSASPEEGPTESPSTYHLRLLPPVS